jgi:hypothetical protein
MNYENFKQGFDKPSIFTAQQYGTKVSVEVDHSDMDLDEVMDALQTLIIGLGYHENSFKNWVIDRANEYNETDAEELKEKLEAWKFDDESIEELENDFFGSYDAEAEKRMDIIGQNGNDGLHYRATQEDEDEFIDNNTTKCYCGHTDYCDCQPEDESEFDDYGKRIEKDRVSFEWGDEPEEDYDGQFDDWKNETPEDDLFEGDEWKSNQKLVQSNERYKKEVKKMNSKKRNTKD